MTEERTERFAAVSVGEPTQESTRVDDVVGESPWGRQKVKSPSAEKSEGFFALRALGGDFVGVNGIKHLP